MPSKVRIISARNSADWDDLIRDVMRREAYRNEHTYFGITSPERADKVRRNLRTAAGHLGVSVKAFWYDCGGCNDGGADCRYHVSYTVYPLDEARAYKAARAQQQP